MYGSPSVAEGSEESGRVSLAMVDYWLSLAVSGTPNDGKGLASTSSSLLSLLHPLIHLPNAETNWPQYTPDNQVR